MISGIKLPSKPDMSGVTFEKIFGNLDTLNKRLPEVSFTCKNGTVISRKEYWGDKYNTTILDYSIPSDPGYKVVSGLFKLISEALPDFITTHEFREKLIIISYPRYSNWKVNDTYKLLIDEIQRVSLFLLSIYGPDGKEIICELLKKYIDLCVEISND